MNAHVEAWNRIVHALNTTPGLPLSVAQVIQDVETVAHSLAHYEQLKETVTDELNDVRKMVSEIRENRKTKHEGEKPGNVGE